MVIQKPGTPSYFASTPAAEALAIVPWSAASCQCLTAIRRPAAQLSASATSPAAKMSAAELCHFGADDDPRLLDIKSSRFGYPTLWNDAGDGDRLCSGTSSGATRVTATPRRASDAAASHPMKPALTTTAERASELTVRSAANGWRSPPMTTK
jgi:hypothetical protein